MGLVATLRDVQKNTDAAELNRYNPERPIVVDGSLSELVTQALNIAYSKKNTTTGDPYHGNPNPTGNPPPGAGNLPNIHKPDAPQSAPPIRPTLESMQQMDEVAAEQIAYALSDAINAKVADSTSVLKEEPLMIYAIPRNGMVTEDMNATIDMYHDSGAVDIGDFVFVYSDTTQGNIDYQVHDVNQKVKDYEGRGAKVYPDLQSFLNDLPNIRRR
jgi:hypothetical protein